jgi:Secretion system C-terminal sorting domain
MKKFTLLCFLIILSHKTIQSQTIISDSNGINLILSSDYKDKVLTVTQPLKIINMKTATISGQFSSSGAVNIIPTASYSIIIKPFVASSLSPTARMMTEDTTVIRSSSGSKTLDDPLKPDIQKLTIYPSQVDTTLNFSSSSENVTSYQVNNLNGALSTTQNIIPTTSSTIDVSNLTSGYYVLTLKLQNSYFKTLFIKN